MTIHSSTLKLADDTRARVIIYGLAEAARQLQMDPESVRLRIHGAGLKLPRCAWKRWGKPHETIERRCEYEEICNQAGQAQQAVQEVRQGQVRLLT